MNTQVNANRKAAMFSLAGMMTLGISDNFVAFVAPVSSLWQFHLVRGLMVLGIVCAVALIFGNDIRPKRFWPVFARSAMIALSMLIYFGCIAIMPISLVVAGLFTSPLFILLIAIIFQGQRVGPWRVLAVLIGFAGALMVVQPDPNALDPLAFLPMLAGLLYAISAVATRAWCEGESTTSLTVMFFSMLVAFGLIGVLIFPGEGGGAEGFPTRGWMPMTGVMFGWYVAQAIGAAIGIVCLFRAYQLGEASKVAVFEYSMLVFASFWAWVIWGQTVSALGIIGMAMIFVAGSIIALRSEAA